MDVKAELTPDAPPPQRLPAQVTYVVGIGASAGGLEALEQFFKHCPPDSGAVFVVIQHLSPDHKSMMSGLLGRHTRMPVVVVENDMAVTRDHVYLIPPGVEMRIASGHLYLKPKSPYGLTLPIDIFFTSLAEAFGNRAVGVVLSGTGSDGTRGAVAINAAGGFLLAQDPSGAKFDGMPRSAIATGLVDAVLPAAELPGRLLSHLQNQPYQATVVDDADDVAGRAPLSSDEAVTAILSLMLQVGSIDFQEYKHGTVLRRIERRMQVRSVASLQEYADLLEQDRQEQVALRRELLISVTSFFRDPEAFDVVAEHAVKSIVANTGSGESVRVWVTGASTGEEAYSIGMLFLEAFDRERRWPSLKIIATDVNQQNVELAGAGQYPESAAAELTQERVERFFSRSGNTLTVKPELRQCILFARHNLLSDPPFTKMDLVSCRNTLIYFRPDAQKRAIHRLHYALRPGGFLFLGSSESITGTGAGLLTTNAKHKLFTRTGAAQPLMLDFAGSRTGGYDGTARHLRKGGPSRQTLIDGQVVDRALNNLLSTYCPPAILVNDRHEAVHFFGDIQRYFRVREGAPSLALSRILPDALVPVASALMFKLARDGESLVSDYVQVTAADGTAHAVRLLARPLDETSDERFVVLCFEGQPEHHANGDVPALDVDAETMARIDVLERELLATRESLQATIEELETSNEELQATNEELMASNEELQSSNEELQAVNEELNTVNAELQEKIVILNRVNADLDGMARAVGVATVFVDQQLELTRFSPDAVGLFNLRESDIGRPLADITHRLRYPAFIDDLRVTLAAHRMVEREVMSLDDRLYLMRVLPYSVASSPVRGAVATFVDVSHFRDLRRLQGVLDAMPEHVAVLDHDGRIALVNAAWRDFALANGDPGMRATGPGVNYVEVCRRGGGDRSSERAARGVQAVLDGTLPVFSMRYPCHSPSQQRWFAMNVAPVGGSEFGAVVSHIDISHWYPNPPRDVDGDD